MGAAIIADLAELQKSCEKAEVTMFGDDNKPFQAGKSVDPLLKNDERLFSWFATSKMSVNAEKCQMISMWNASKS